MSPPQPATCRVSGVAVVFELFEGVVSAAGVADAVGVAGDAGVDTVASCWVVVWVETSVISRGVGIPLPKTQAGFAQSPEAASLLRLLLRLSLLLTVSRLRV